MPSILSFDILRSSSPSYDEFCAQRQTEQILSSKQSEQCEVTEGFQQLLNELSENVKDMDEKDQIVQAVNRLVKNIAVKLGDEFRLRCSPILVGSAAEKTRCFRPDEFDFLLLFYSINRYFQYHRHGERYVLSKLLVDSGKASTNPLKEQSNQPSRQTSN